MDFEIIKTNSLTSKFLQELPNKKETATHLVEMRVRKGVEKIEAFSPTEASLKS